MWYVNGDEAVAGRRTISPRGQTNRENLCYLTTSATVVIYRPAVYLQNQNEVVDGGDGGKGSTQKNACFEELFLN